MPATNSLSPGYGHLADFAAQLVTHLAVPACILDHCGTIRACNARFAQIIDRPDDDIPGTLFGRLLEASDAKSLDKFLVANSCGKHAVAPHRSAISVGENTWPFSVRTLHANAIEPFHLCQLSATAQDDGPHINFLMEHFDQGFWDFDISNRRFVVLDAWRRKRSTERASASDDWLAEVHTDDREKLKELFDGRLRGDGDGLNIQYRRWHLDGYWVWVLCRASVMDRDQDGKPTRIVGVDTEITNVKNNEADLLRLAGKLQLAVEVSGMGIWEFDADKATVHWDDQLLSIFGVTDGQNERAHELWETFLHPDDREETRAYAEECRIKNLDFNRDYRIVRPDGETRHIRSLARYVNLPGTRGKLIGVNIDVTGDYQRAEELERARRQLEHDSRHDALTGLGNRRLLDECIAQLFETVGEDDEYCVLNIDLDRFKLINDTLGHLAGDAVLIHVARELRRVVGDAGTPFRVGGDEFVVLMETAPSRRDIETICQALIAAFDTPFRYEGFDCDYGASIGYVTAKGKPDDPADVFVKADAALYAAKYAGRSCYRRYHCKDTPAPDRNAITYEELRDAIARDQIVCYFQPQFAAGENRVVGAEALVRWASPRRGVLEPGQFMPLAVQSGLIARIDEIVFHRVMSHQAEWRHAGIDVPLISLNVSGQRLRDESLVEQVREFITPGHKIAFELLETSLIERMDPNLAFILDSLRELGVRLDLDDFGSGHSSIVALQSIGPDRVKFDRRLIAPICTQPRQFKILCAMADIARCEGAEIIVEGVETDRHLAAISTLDHDAAQGFALARPMPADDFVSMIAPHGTWHTRPIAANAG